MSVAINEVVETLRNLKVPSDIIVKVETELEAIEAEKKEENLAAGPKAKSKYVTILLDPNNKLNGLGDFTSLVTQIPENDDAGETLNKLYKSAHDQKTSAKKKIKNITTVIEAASGVKRKYFKNNNLHIKTKNPIRALISNNVIPAI